MHTRETLQKSNVVTRGKAPGNGKVPYPAIDRVLDELVVGNLPIVRGLVDAVIEQIHWPLPPHDVERDDHAEQHAG